MYISFRSYKKDWKAMNKDEIIRHYSDFASFMARYEEDMTFDEADRYWNKFEKLEQYIETTYGVNAREEERKLWGLKCS